MKKTSKGLFLALALMMTVQTAGNVVLADGNAENGENQLSIWGTYNTEKVLQNPEYNHNNYHLEAKLDVASATGAAESGQIIITTGDTGVNAYTVTTSNLTSENGDIYNGENVDVFFQRYIKISEKSHLANPTTNLCKYSDYEEAEYNGDYFPAADPNGPVTSGYTPDAVIPQDVSIEYKENFIIPNANQGITFDFNVPTGTPAGTYTGNFTLTIDGVNHTIHVTLRVWDYDLSKTNGMNLWDIVDGYYGAGELTSSDSIYYAYYEELLKYKLNAYHFNENADDEVHWVKSLRKYWKDPAFNGVFLPDLGAERARMMRFFTEIAKAAIEDEIDYFSKCRFYHQAEDEPQMKNPSLVPQAVTVLQRIEF